MLYSILFLIFLKLIRLHNAGGVTISSTDWSALADSLDGDVMLPTDDNYDTSYRAWTATYDDVKPEAVVYCKSESDVVTVMNFILEHASEDGSVMDFAVRSGGHNLAGWSSSDGVVIDLSGLNQLYVSEDNTAIVGPGVSLSIFTKFAEENDFTLPHGDCASVCFGGFLNGGGFGLISRTFGMGVDWIKSINVVLPTGELIQTSQEDEYYGDLFWALRGGGGGNFGIVTQYEMNIPQKELKSPGLYLEISWNYDSNLWGEIASTWNSFVQDQSYGNHFAVYLRITPVTYITKDYYIQLHGFWTGEQVDGLMVVAKLLDKISVTPTQAKVDYVSFEGWIESSASDRLRYSSHCSSRFAFDTLSKGFFDAISTTLEDMISYDNYADPTDEDELTYGNPTEFLFIAPAGGAISNHAIGDTAFPWRDATYLFVVCARYMNDYENAYDFVEKWIVSTMDTVEPFLSDKSFINFPDNNLVNWQNAFYGDNYARLQSVKGKYDPNNIFRFKFSIEQPETNIYDSTSRFKPKSISPKKVHEFSIENEQVMQQSSNDDGKKGASSAVIVTSYVIAITTIVLLIAVIFKLTSKNCKNCKTRHTEYTPVNNQQVSSYNTI